MIQYHKHSGISRKSASDPLDDRMLRGKIYSLSPVMPRDWKLVHRVQESPHLPSQWVLLSIFRTTRSFLGTLLSDKARMKDLCWVLSEAILFKYNGTILTR